MRKMLAGKIILLVLLVIIPFGINGGLQAQGDTPEFAPAFLMNTAEGIVFYGVNWNNEVAEIGRLPDNIGIYDPDRTYEWQINAKANFVLSPDRQNIAFVAHKYDESVGALYIYHLKSQNLETAAVVEGCEGLYQPRMQWSPDSEIIMASMGHCGTGEVIFYRLNDQEQLVVPDNFIYGGYWGKDSRILLSPGREHPDHIFLFDTWAGLETTLATFEKVNLPVLTFPSVGICNFKWSETFQRWFFTVGCEDSSNYPNLTYDYLYSVNWDGEVRLELALPDFYSAIYPQLNTDDTNYRYVEIRSIIPMKSGLYIVVEFGWRDLSILYYEIIEDSFMRPREILSFPMAEYWLTTFSPEGKMVALQNYYGIIDFRGLPGDEHFGEIEGLRDSTQQHNFGFWLDEARFLYARQDGGIGIFYIFFDDRTDINLVAGLSSEAFIFRQTHS